MKSPKQYSTNDWLQWDDLEAACDRYGLEDDEYEDKYYDKEVEEENSCSELNY